MNTFVNAALNEENLTRTENGALAYKSTRNALVDFFAVIGALRHGKCVDNSRAEVLFEEALKEDPLLTVKTLFYARDIREGLGERDVFRHLIGYAAKRYPSLIKENIDLIGLYGRFDDLYSLIGTSLEEDMWKVMKDQFEADKAALNTDASISLLAKWIKTPDASSKATRKLGAETATHLGYSIYDFKRILRKMRSKIRVTESLMSANQWEEIDYSTVPSRAMMIYRNAFSRHDEARFEDFISKAVRGEEKINSSALYPYDIVEKYLRGEKNNVLEAQWKQLPDYVGDENVLIMADVSGSMCGRPMASSIGLAMYFAERNKGEFHNLFMTFSDEPNFVRLKGDTLSQKIRFIRKIDWDMNTNLYAAFQTVFNLCVENNVPASDVPKAIVVVTDMEIDSCDAEDGDWMFYDRVRTDFEEAGYAIPTVVFWNVNSRNDTFLADAKRRGVILVSGQSINTFKALINCINMTPYEFMLSVLNSKRYEPISVPGL